MNPLLLRFMARRFLSRHSISTCDKSGHQLKYSALRNQSEDDICACPLVYEIVKKLTDYFKKDHEVIDIDGARVLFKDGWGLVRASNTQPVLVLRYEAKTKEGLDKIKKTFITKLKEFPEVKL